MKMIQITKEELLIIMCILTTCVLFIKPFTKLVEEVC